MTYEEFKNKNMGKYLDYDGSYGNQCWDLAQFYFVEVLNLPDSILSGCGLVSNMLYQPKRTVLNQYFDEISINNMNKGDVIIWDWGHIAIYDHCENGNCYYFSQNPGPCHIEVIKSGGAYAFRKKGSSKIVHNIGYKAHIQSDGWQDWKFDGQTAGTTGKSKKMEAIRIDYKGDVYAKAHIESIGWVDYGKINKNTIIGTTGKAKRLECLCLKGNFKYRVHIQGTGWTCWTKADGICTLGSVGQSLRLEAIEIIEL